MKISLYLHVLLNQIGIVIITFRTKRMAIILKRLLIFSSSKNNQKKILIDLNIDLIKINEIIQIEN